MRRWCVRLNGESLNNVTWGPFDDEDSAREFAQFVFSEIDPCEVARLMDPAQELLSWRTSEIDRNDRIETPEQSAVIVDANLARMGINLGGERAATDKPSATVELARCTGSVVAGGAVIHERECPLHALPVFDMWRGVLRAG
jgi:hypothetical protein